MMNSPWRSCRMQSARPAVSHPTFLQACRIWSKHAVILTTRFPSVRSMRRNSRDTPVEGQSYFALPKPRSPKASKQACHFNSLNGRRYSRIQIGKVYNQHCGSRDPSSAAMLPREFEAPYPEFQEIRENLKRLEGRVRVHWIDSYLAALHLVWTFKDDSDGSSRLRVAVGYSRCDHLEKKTIQMKA